MAKTSVVLLLLLGCSTPEAASPDGLRIALFASDVTPPLGHPLIKGVAEEILQPMVLKGIILDDGRSRVVIGAMDWCVLRGGAYDLFRNKMAVAAGVPVTHVSIHMTHTHSAPLVDARAEQLLAATSKPVKHLDLEWLARMTTDAARAVETGVHNLQPFTHIGMGQAKVEHFASTRRVKGPDGKIQVRYSATKDPELRAQPEGRIDPWLKTVTFFDGDTPIVRLHYYASHPQSYYGDGKVHPDTPGLARSYLEGEEGVSQIYFTGCAGDVTAGKYNDGSPEGRQALSKELYSGMIRAIAATKKEAVSSFSWKSVDVALPHKEDPKNPPELLRRTLEDPEAPAEKRQAAAIRLAWAERVRRRPTLDLGRLRIGSL
ncbi:MAG TPA: hypothetical protein VG457_18485, partial [Planctomycetota bacterium]|nr:hypothetical protein [Planctomycetota bacterium]